MLGQSSLLLCRQKCAMLSFIRTKRLTIICSNLACCWSSISWTISVLDKTICFCCGNPQSLYFSFASSFVALLSDCLYAAFIASSLTLCFSLAVQSLAGHSIKLGESTGNAEACGVFRAIIPCAATFPNTAATDITDMVTHSSQRKQIMNQNIGKMCLRSWWIGNVHQSTYIFVEMHVKSCTAEKWDFC